MIKFIILFAFLSACKIEFFEEEKKEEKKEAESVDENDPGDNTDGDSLGASYMLIEKKRLLLLPTIGSAWEFLKDNADKVLDIELDETKESSPWLTNYNDRGEGRRLPVKYLAAALVYASALEGDKEPYRAAVSNAIRHIIGSEEELSTDGTSEDSALLSTCRQLAAWVMMADLINFDKNMKGTRTTPGKTTNTLWTNVSFEQWLQTILTKKISNHSRWTTVKGTQEDSASNWSAHCTAARTAVAIYLEDTEDLERSVQVYKGFLGDQSSYPTLRPSGDWDLKGIIPSGAFDSSWACNYSEEKNGWSPINPPDCGPEKDGIVVDDISRSDGSFPNYNPKGISYFFETLQGLYLTAILLERKGYDPFEWSQKALKRSMDWLHRNNQIPSYDAIHNSYDTEHHVPWVANYYYNMDYPTQNSSYGRSLTFTDWLFPKESN